MNAKVLSEYSTALIVRYEGDVGDPDLKHDLKRYVSHETTRYALCLAADAEARKDGIFRRILQGAVLHGPSVRLVHLVRRKGT